jgi:hypothetical protein
VAPYEYYWRLGRVDPFRGPAYVNDHLVTLALASPAERCDAVLAGSTPGPVRERAVTACREAGHVPGGPVRRAAFLLLTGQWQWYGELDGDGELLTAAYQDGNARQRLRLRAAMAASRDRWGPDDRRALDLLRTWLDHRCLA